jgi:hypothetical protein
MSLILDNLCKSYGVLKARLWGYAVQGRARVFPAKAGVPKPVDGTGSPWIPAFAGKTEFFAVARHAHP